ncbi:efflux RND transporter periplasmic adaptor subunit [Krasilnikovia sp. MM14-A1004]|uniref:efflux RND transporter periplasmic adaptor subunit n=1 Tax=Krasilnikovia sp. MM14-A1004 TaxID=3373541 RepID=UPI00399D41E0
MDGRRLACAGATVLALALLSGCTGSKDKPETPDLEARGTVLTTVKPTRQDLSNQISLAGKVTINPVFGIVAPTDGELRYVDRQPSKTPATRPIWVATVWRDGVPRRVEIPKDSLLAGRLMDDHADVTAGMPVISAQHAGYGIVADIDSEQAYRVSGAVKTVRGQIKNGPGPFTCTTLGTIAALPAGTIPAPPAPKTPAPQQSGQPAPAEAPEAPEAPPAESGGSEPTGMRLVCVAPDTVKLINGAAVTLEVVTAKASKALVLPVEAVAGVQGRGKVDVVGADRTRRTVDVVLGLTDGKVVQIKSGLRGDETIAVPGPDLPAAPPGGENPGDGASGAPR